MPHHKSCKKRLITSRKANLANRAERSHMRHQLRDFRGLTDKDAAAGKLPEMISLLDKMAKKGIIKKQKADRLKSRLYAHQRALG